jgi:hypothetical protein
MRDTLNSHENTIYEREVEIEKYKSDLERERISMEKFHSCEIARVT